MTNERNTDPIINYEHHHTQEVVTKFMLEYLQDDKLTIKIFGTQDIKNKKGSRDKS